MNAITEVSVLLSCRQRLSGTGLAKLNSQQENVITDSVPGEDVTIASGLSTGLETEGASSSLRFCSWTRAEQSVSRFISFSDFFGPLE